MDKKGKAEVKDSSRHRVGDNEEEDRPTKDSHSKCSHKKH